MCDQKQNTESVENCGNWKRAAKLQADGSFTRSTFSAFINFA